MHIITGFHAIEECLRVLQCRNKEGLLSNIGSDTENAGIHNYTHGLVHEYSYAQSLQIMYAKKGPRVKKILSLAAECGIAIEQSSAQKLNTLVQSLPSYLREHRGIILIDSRSGEKKQISAALGDTLLARITAMERAFAVVLDCITDPHNIGAIIRSADQFSIDAVILSRRHTPADEGILCKASAGAAAWAPLVHTSNTVRTVEMLKQNGFWVFGADAHGEPLPAIRFPQKTALVMGSEGSGIGKLLAKTCDGFVSIPAKGNIDSLNVSVAAGILMYEISRR